MAESNYDLGEASKVRPKKAKQLAQKTAMKAQAGENNIVTDAYKQLRDSNNPAFADLLAKIKAFAEYHTKVAKDRTGFERRNEVTPEGKTVVVENVVKLDRDEQTAELQRAAGIEEIADYIARRLV